jgi:uncharacterized protein
MESSGSSEEFQKAITPKQVNERYVKTPFHVMLIPTLGCPSRCSYCWSSEEGSPVMALETISEVVEWLRDFRDDRITFTFHGGEPLLAGADFYRNALPMLSEGLAHMNPEFAMQSNLWRLTPELARILAEYHIPIGSSIDGPEEINDSQRGKGYFEKTMRGYKIACENGLTVRFICTFTCHSVKHREEIFNFFLKNGLTLKLHPALPSLRSEEPKKWALDPAEYGELLVYLLDQSLDHFSQIQVMNINDLCRCVFTQRGSVCTFVNCLGNTLAVGPEGSIYPCYRFIGMNEWIMGNVCDHPGKEDLARSEAWKRMQGFTNLVDRECRACAHIRYCRGGCPYNAIASSGGELPSVDPYCTAYRRIFNEINDRLSREMSGDSGLETSAPGSEKTARPGIMALIYRMISEKS